MILFLSLLLIIAFMINPKFLEASEIIGRPNHDCYNLCYNKDNLDLYNKTLQDKNDLGNQKINFCAFCQNCSTNTNNINPVKHPIKYKHKNNINSTLSELQDLSNCKLPNNSTTIIHGGAIDETKCEKDLIESSYKIFNNMDKFSELTNFCSVHGNCKKAKRQIGRSC